MTAKRVEDLFLADDLRAIGELTLGDAVVDAVTHEEVVAIMELAVDRLKARAPLPPS
jgi:hypothetical protein